jgi:hypothetical protein
MSYYQTQTIFQEVTYYYYTERKAIAVIKERVPSTTGNGMGNGTRNSFPFKDGHVHIEFLSQDDVDRLTVDEFIAYVDCAQYLTQLYPWANKINHSFRQRSVEGCKIYLRDRIDKLQGELDDLENIGQLQEELDDLGNPVENPQPHQPEDPVDVPAHYEAILDDSDD